MLGFLHRLFSGWGSCVLFSLLALYQADFFLLFPLRLLSFVVEWVVPSSIVLLSLSVMVSIGGSGVLSHGAGSCLVSFSLFRACMVDMVRYIMILDTSSISWNTGGST